MTLEMSLAAEDFPSFSCQRIFGALHSKVSTEADQAQRGVGGRTYPVTVPHDGHLMPVAAASAIGRLIPKGFAQSRQTYSCTGIAYHRDVSPVNRLEYFIHAARASSQARDAAKEVSEVYAIRTHRREAYVTT